MKHAPVEPGATRLGTTGQQVEAIGMDQLHRQQLGEIRQTLGLGPGNLELGVAILLLGEADGNRTPLELALGEQDKSLLALANDSPGKMSAKGAAQAKVVNGFQHAGLAAAIAAHQDVEAGRQLQAGVLDVAKVVELEFDQGHD